MKPVISVLLVALCALVAQISAKNVLFLYPNASPSHKNIGIPIMHGLAERGHNITVVSSFKTEPHPNIRDIHPITNFDYFETDVTGLDVRRQGIWGMVFVDWNPTFKGCHMTYQHPEFQALMNQQFDLVLMDAFANECLLGFVHKLGAPFVYISPLPVPSYIAVHVGNRLPSSFVPTFLGDYSREMKFCDRLKNFVYSRLAGYGFRRPFDEHAEIYRKYLGEDLPDVDTILANTSMIMTNSHFAFNLARPTLPDVVEIGGIHCRPGRPLSKEMDEFLSGAKDGFILFSLGSIVRPQDLPEETRKVFVNVFSRLKQRVLWKWPNEMPDKPANVMLSKWIPQQDVLAHPNARLFITHSGLLSTQESMYHGVPMVAVPVLGDQNLNARFATEAGIAITLEILEVTEEQLDSAINEVLHNPSYKEKIQEFSTHLRDQPETPKERAVFWAEYVMRHKGARHLRSAARELNVVQYYCLDVVGVILIVFFSVVALASMVLRRIIRALGKIVNAKKAPGDKKRQ